MDIDRLSDIAEEIIRKMKEIIINVDGILKKRHEKEFAAASCS